MEYIAHPLASQMVLNAKPSATRSQGRPTLLLACTCLCPAGAHQCHLVPPSCARSRRSPSCCTWTTEPRFRRTSTAAMTMHRCAAPQVDPQEEAAAHATGSRRETGPARSTAAGELRPACGHLGALSACCITAVTAENQRLVPYRLCVPRGTCALVENPAVPTGGKLA